MPLTPTRRSIFGTDGVRDRFGEGLFSPDSLGRIATAFRVAMNGDMTPAPAVLLGRDTRSSGLAIETVVASALIAAGCRVHTAGILPTPALSQSLARHGYSLGIMISASHNPPEFNGLKLFDSQGRKISKALEDRITEEYLALSSVEIPPAEAEPRLDLREDYLGALPGAKGDLSLDGLEVVLDCARGATATVATEAFARAGAAVTGIFTELDGSRINAGCGSLHPEELCRRVVAAGADLGIAFDGDGDRAIVVDDRGETLDGDGIIALWAVDLERKGLLSGNRVVLTILSNRGIEKFLRGHGIEVLRASVGDREVFGLMEESGAVLGGEPSGHIMYRREAVTGDGIRTGLHLASIVRSAGVPLSSLRSSLKYFPQVVEGIEVKKRPPISELPELAELLDQAQADLGPETTIIVRYSGTEPVLRLFLEGPDEERIQIWIARLAHVAGHHPLLQTD